MKSCCSTDFMRDHLNMPDHLPICSLRYKVLVIEVGKQFLKALCRFLDLYVRQDILRAIAHNCICICEEHVKIVPHQMYGAKPHEYLNKHLKESPKNWKKILPLKNTNLTFYPSTHYFCSSQTQSLQQLTKTKLHAIITMVNSRTQKPFKINIISAVTSSTVEKYLHS